MGYVREAGVPKMRNDNEKDKTLKYDLDQVRKALEGQDTENLRCLYTEYSARMRNRGAQIWIIGSVFIPLSISGVALGLTGIRHILAVAFFSIALIWTWFFISLALRNGFERALVICATIETVMLNRQLPLSRRGLDDLIVPLQKEKGVRLRHIRLVISFAITVMWLLVVILSIPSNAIRP
jgi:hypothetical protein